MTMPHRPSEPCVAVVVPIRQLYEHGEPVVIRRPGRPRRVETAPCISQAAYESAISRAAEREIEKDEIVVAATANDPKKVINEVMAGVAQESAALLWDRIRSTREGKSEGEKISSRRVAGLLRLAELAVLREEMEREDPDPKPEDIEKVLGMLFAEVEEAVAETAPPEVAAAFLKSLKAKVAASGLFSTGTAGSSTS